MCDMSSRDVRAMGLVPLIAFKNLGQQEKKESREEEEVGCEEKKIEKWRVKRS